MHDPSDHPRSEMGTASFQVSNDEVRLYYDVGVEEDQDIALGGPRPSVTRRCRTAVWPLKEPNWSPSPAHQLAYGRQYVVARSIVDDDDFPLISARFDPSQSAQCLSERSGASKCRDDK